jgi:DNA-binding IclR family transcriptional regulator
LTPEKRGENARLRPKRLLQGHRTISRVTQILEEVVYHPGMTFSDLVRTLNAAKSSVHGFIRGLLAAGWLHEENGRFYLGPAVYRLTLASGHISAEVVTYADLLALHNQTKAAVFLGVPTAEHLIYVAEAGSDPVTGFDARTNIRRGLLETAGGKALLAQCSDVDRDAYLRRRNSADPTLVSAFLNEFSEIRRTRIATNLRHNGSRFAIATTVHNRPGYAVGSITLVGAASEFMPRANSLSKLLLRCVDQMQSRTSPRREAV